MNSKLIIRLLTQQPYQSTWQAMQAFTQQRDQRTPDELWLLQHPPVFTQGLAGKPEHVLNPHNIPIVQTDRGGQVTYHGPGQLVGYTLFDMQRLELNTRSMVEQVEQAVINLLAEYAIQAHGDRDAPGVYVNNAKICSIGLRVKRHCSYHGIALNVNMDLTPFSYINPCGFKGLQMAQISDTVPNITVAEVAQQIVPFFISHFGYAKYHTTETPYEQNATV